MNKKKQNIYHAQLQEQLGSSPRIARKKMLKIDVVVEFLAREGISLSIWINKERARILGLEDFLSRILKIY